MKVTVDVDCSPEEARRFLGLPDLGPVHAAYVERMQKAVAESGSPEMMKDLLRSWAPMGEAGMNLWAGMFDKMGGKR